MTSTNTLPKLSSCISVRYNDNFDFLVKIRIFFHISLQNQENLLYLCNQNQKRNGQIHPQTVLSMKPNEFENESGLCPYCGSEDIQVLCDGTYRCLECGMMWR
jgi:uncharacterized Zn-finger protein